MVGTLGDHLVDPTVSIEIRHEIPYVLSEIPSQDSVNALFRYRDESHRAGFLASDAVRDMRKELDQLWTRITESTWAKAGVNPS